MHAPQPAKTVLRNAGAPEIGHLDALGVADHDVFDLSFAVKKNADLASRLVGQLGKLARQFRRNDLLRRDAARRQTLDAAQLIML
jgi:hypothetical protein